MHFFPRRPAVITLLAGCVTAWLLLGFFQEACEAGQLPLIAVPELCHYYWALDGLWLVLVFGALIPLLLLIGRLSTVLANALSAAVVFAVFALLLSDIYYLSSTGQLITLRLVIEVLSNPTELVPVMMGERRRDKAITGFTLVVGWLVLIWLIHRPGKLRSVISAVATTAVAVGVIAISTSMLLKPETKSDENRAVRGFQGVLHYFITLPRDTLPVTDKVIRIEPLTATGSIASSAPNILLIILESFRADLIAKNPELVPTLVNFAQRSTHHRRSFAGVIHSSHSLFSLHCGIIPPRKHVQRLWNSSDKPIPCFPAILSNNGYATGFFQSADGKFEQRGNLVDYFGYEHFLEGQELAAAGAEELGYFGQDDKALIPPVRQWIGEQSKPWLATIFTSVTHHPFSIPQRPCTTPGPTEVRRCYDEAVRYTDQAIGELLTGLERDQQLKNTAIIIMGDHGEAFGEHAGAMFHDWVAYPEATQIPILLQQPGQGDPQTDDSLRSANDIASTALALAGLQPEGSMGTSLLAPGKHRQVATFCYFLHDCYSVVRDDGFQFVIPKRGSYPEKYNNLSDPTATTPLAEDPENDRQMLEELAALIAGIDEFYK